jgi:hypothetical protein
LNVVEQKVRYDSLYEYKETASTHADSTREDKLVATRDGRGIQLVRHQIESNVYQPSMPAREDLYEVAVDDLIAFFEVNGQHTRRSLL